MCESLFGLDAPTDLTDVGIDICGCPNMVARRRLLCAKLESKDKLDDVSETGSGARAHLF